MGNESVWVGVGWSWMKLAEITKKKKRKRGRVKEDFWNAAVVL